jgi:hypothetical protein
MNGFFKALAVTALALASTCVISQTQSYNDNDTPSLTPTETAQLKAEREAAKARWATLTRSEKAEVRKNAQQKRWGDLTAIEMVSDNDTEMLTPDQSVQFKSERQAAQAQWAAMSPEAKAAMKKSIRQKRLSEMTELEKVAGSGS